VQWGGSIDKTRNLCEFCPRPPAIFTIVADEKVEKIMSTFRQVSVSIVATFSSILLLGLYGGLYVIPTSTAHFTVAICAPLTSFATAFLLASDAFSWRFWLKILVNMGLQSLTVLAIIASFRGFEIDQAFFTLICRIGGATIFLLGALLIAPKESHKKKTAKT